MSEPSRKLLILPLEMTYSVVVEHNFILGRLPSFQQNHWEHVPHAVEDYGCGVYVCVYILRNY